MERNNSTKFPWPKGQVSSGSYSGLDRPLGTRRGGKFSLSGSLTSERQKWPSETQQPPPAQGCSLPLGGHGQHLCTWLSLWTAWSLLAAESGSQQRATGPACAAQCCSSSGFPVVFSPPTRSLPQNEMAEARDQCPVVSFLPSQERGEALDSTQLLAALLQQSWQVELMGQGCEIFEGRPLYDSPLSPQTQHNPQHRPWHSRYFVNAHWLGYYTFSTTYTPISPQRISADLHSPGSLLWSTQAEVWASSGLLHLLSIPSSITLTTLFISPSPSRGQGPC